MDGLGSLRQMINSAGVPQYLTSYDPFGSPFESYNAIPDPSLGFTGQMTDDNGLQYLRARYYDPSVGHVPQLRPGDGRCGRQLRRSRGDEDCRALLSSRRMG